MMQVSYSIYLRLLCLILGMLSGMVTINLSESPWGILLGMIAIGRTEAGAIEGHDVLISP